MRIKRRVRKYEIQYRIYIDGKFEKDKAKVIEALTADDASAMFNFWAAGESRTWGCEIVGLEIEFKGFAE